MELKSGKRKLFSYPLRLDIVPTMFCNLKCVFCIPYLIEGTQELSLDDFKIVADRFFPYASIVNFCSGGEPFLNKNLLRFIYICRDYHIPVRISTNGMLLSKDICKELVENNCLEFLAFSFDGSKKETVESIRKGINYDNVVGNMRLIAELKKKHNRKNLTLLIRCAAMRSNIEELPDLISKAN